MWYTIIVPRVKVNESNTYNLKLYTHCCWVQERYITWLLVIGTIGWQTLSRRRKIAKLTIMYHMVNKITSVHLVELLDEFCIGVGITTRGQVMWYLTLPLCKTLMYKTSFICFGISLWNQSDFGNKGLPLFLDFKFKIESKFRMNPPLMTHDTILRNSKSFLCRSDWVFSDLQGRIHYRECYDW